MNTTRTLIIFLTLQVATTHSVTKQPILNKQMAPIQAATLKLAKVTNNTENALKVVYDLDGTKYSHTIAGKTSMGLDNTPNVMFIKSLFVDLTPERRYITAPAQSDSWDKIFKQKAAQLKEKKQSGTFGVELKINGPDSLELVTIPLTK